MRLPEKMPIIVFLYSKKDGSLTNYQKITSHTKEEIIALISTNMSETHDYRLMENCSMEDISKAFNLLPERSNVADVKEEIINALNDIERKIDYLEYELKNEPL